MKKDKTERKNSGKARNWFFFALRLFPLVVFALAVHQQGATDLATYFSTFVSAFRFGFVADAFNSALGAMGLAIPTFACDYASWLVLVTFVQLMYDVIVFLPDFARSAFERWTKV